MKNDLTALNNYLFETLERLQDDSLGEEELKKEIVRSNAVTSVAQTIISNAELALKAAKYAEDCGAINRNRGDVMIPQMLS